jgi:hypothetical protein
MSDGDSGFVAVSFGCFNFSVRSPSEFTGRDYARDLTNVLESIPSVENLQIAFPESFLKRKWIVEGDVPAIDSPGGPVPRGAGDISFDLRIPSRLQRELLRLEDWQSLRTHTDQFGIHLTWAWAMPVAAIQPYTDDAETHPSVAVVVVREFLKRELARVPEAKLQLETLGPSPAHVDIYLRPSQGTTGSDTWEFSRTGFSHPAYMQFDFNYNPQNLPPAAVAVAFLFKVQHELDLLYRANRDTAYRLDKWNELSALVDELIALFRDTGLRASLRRTFKTSTRLNEAFIRMMELESFVLQSETSIQKDFRSLYGPGSTHYLEELVKAELDDDILIPIAQVQALLQQFDSRRLKDREILFGIVGALIGAAATLIAVA